MQHFFWSLIIVIRKFCIVITYLMFRTNPHFQLAASLLIMFLAYALQVKNQPYMSPSQFENVLHKHTIAAVTSPLHQRLKLTLASIESRGHKRVRRNVLTATGHIDPRAALGILGSWLFDYNTVCNGPSDV